MTTAVTKTEVKLTPMDVLFQGMDALQQNVAQDLKDTGIDPHKFLATAKTAIQKHQQRDRLAAADRNSLYLAIKDAAQQGLMPDGKEGALVVYNNTIKDATGKERKVDEVSFQPMVIGIVKLLRQSGEVLDVDGAVVFKNDKFKFSLGVDKMPEHTPDWFASMEERGEPVGAWAFIKLSNGEVKAKMLPKDKIQRIAARSKMAKNYSPKDGQDWEEFWIKAAIRNVSKFAPKTPKLERALLADDNEFEMNKAPVTAPTAAAIAAPSEPATRETAAAKAVRERAEAKAKAPQAAPDEQQQEQSNVVDADYTEADDDNNEPPI
jgi:recombination protein RecT